MKFWRVQRLDTEQTEGAMLTIAYIFEFLMARGPGGAMIGFSIFNTDWILYMKIDPFYIPSIGVHITERGN